jgi:hypothetical protein
MSFVDHFNFPNASRGDTMYLSTLRTEDAAGKKSFARNRSSNLDITDIDKARPHYQGYQYNQKETFANRNDDIHGSAPKKLHQPLEKVYYNLRNDDINGSKPQSHKFVTTRLPSNPLTPDYMLPQVEVRVATPPKFIRDNISIKDIDGARPNPYTRYNIQRKTNNVEDIDGAKPKKEWLPQGKQSTLDVRDINYFWEFHTKRQTDPLSPRYKVVDENNSLYEYGKVENKCAVRHPKDVNKVTSFDLRTTDIDGAQASTSTQHVNKLATRDQYMKTQDIFGAQASTLKKGITTGRHLDPLWPSYKVPGHTEPPPVYTRNGKPASTSALKTTTNFGVRTDLSTAAVDVVKSSSVANVDSVVQSAASVLPVQRQKSGEAVIAPVQTNNRRVSGEKTPLQVTNSAATRGVTSPLLRNGEDIVNTNTVKSFGGTTEYVPARMPQKPEVAAKSGLTLENKKTMNSSETYQKNVKNFFGVSNLEDNSYKSKSNNEKFDRFIK